MKIYNNTDEYIFLEPGETLHCRCSKITKNNYKLAELIVDEQLKTQTADE